MDRNIKVVVEDRVATTEGDPSFICGNSTYTVTFTFDDEWEDFEVKTALFKWLTADGMKKHEQPFTGDTVEAPVFFDTREVEVGVYAGDLTTTTGAPVRCTPSIRCNAGEDVEPEPDKYDALMDLIKGRLPETDEDNGDNESGEAAERPTASVFIPSGDFVGYSKAGGFALALLSWEEQLPVGTELKTIKLKHGQDWIDIHELHILDSYAYTLNMSKVYTDDDDTGGYVYAVLGKVGFWGVIVEALQQESIEEIEIIYYTDGGAA